jgi:hypothetical protein
LRKTIIHVSMDLPRYIGDKAFFILAKARFNRSRSLVLVTSIISIVKGKTNTYLTAKVVLIIQFSLPQKGTRNPRMGSPKKFAGGTSVSC